MRTLELPLMDDEKSLAQAVSFQAQDQVPMPLANAVLDFHSVGVIDTPDGPRQKVVLVAAQRDMIESLLDAVRAAGLQPEGVDLSAFALIRSLYKPNPDAAGRVLYLNVDGLTNLAIADGPVCSFTRVVGGGLEGMAAELAERRGIPVASARELIAEFDLDARPEPTFESPLPAPAVHEPLVSEEPGAPDEPVVNVEPEEGPSEHEVSEHPGAEHEAASHESYEPSLPPQESVEQHESAEHAGSDYEDAASLPAEHPLADAETFEVDAAAPETAEEHSAREAQASYAELMAAAEAATARAEEEPAPSAASDEDIRAVIENGIRELAGEVRNSLDFHRSQEPGGEVQHVALSGAALGVSGFAEALGAALDIEVRAEYISLADSSLDGTVATHRLAVATGLATQEALK
jgi:Tfp pilus assembly PilM family ATPase